MDIHADPARSQAERQIGKRVSTRCMERLDDRLGAPCWTGWFRPGAHDLAGAMPTDNILISLFPTARHPGRMPAMALGLESRDELRWG